MIDTHAHLESLADPDGEIAAAHAAGVEAMVAIGVDLDSSLRSLALARRHEGVYATVGHDPGQASAPDLERLRGLAADPRVVAIGEIGVDGPSAPDRPLASQVDHFEVMCDLAIETDLPVCVHVREAAAETYSVMAARPRLRGVMHYFTLDRVWAERFVALGFYLSFAGVVTRPTRASLREVAAWCPDDRLLLETDAPFGIPRGRRGDNRPAWIMDTAAVVADLRGISVAELSVLESRNARALFQRLPASSSDPARGPGADLARGL